MSVKSLDANDVALAGTNLIEASAGTGKTYAIATLYVRSLLETNARVENILVVTYTRAATAELRDRIRRRITQTQVALRLGTSEDISLQAYVQTRIANDDVEGDCKRLSLALRSFDQASIFTIHGFCQRCLQESAFESGTSFESEFEADDRQLAAEIADDFWANEMYAIDPGLFAFYQGRKLSPTELRKLAQQIIGNPDLLVLPDRVAPATVGIDDFEASFREARVCWRNEREEIVQILLGHEDLKKTSYKPEQIVDKYVPAADHLFASPSPTLIEEEHFLRRLTTEALASGKGTRRGKKAPRHEFFDLASAVVKASEAAAASFEGELIALQLRLVDYVREQNSSRKDSRATLSFDDLLLQLRAALRDGEPGELFTGALAERYPIALIDEFQDTDPVQYEIFRRIYFRGSEATVGRTLFLIGDPKQAIYGFRGADLFTYFKARSDAEDRTHTLATNYRSSPAMVAAVNTVFSHPKDAFLYPELEFTPVAHSPFASDVLADAETKSAALEILVLDRKRDDGSDFTKRNKQGEPGAVSKGLVDPLCSERIAGEIVRLLESDATIDDRAVLPGDIAVLVRTNQQARNVQEALRALSVPSVLESDSSVFETNEATELSRVLHAIAFPGNRSAIRSALATDLLGHSGNDLARLREDERGWETALYGFRRWHDTWAQRGFFPAYSQMMLESNVAARLLTRQGGERAMTNLGQLAELLQERALQANSGPQVLCGWLETLRVDKAARGAAGEAAQLRLETDAASVTVVTVHKSKGLEYGIVYCPFLWQGQSTKRQRARVVRFHDQDDSSKLKLDIGSDELEEHKHQFNRETLAEDLRLLYVALTRARHRCSVVCGVVSSFGSSALAYLLLRQDNLDTSWEGLQAFGKNLERLEDAELWAALAPLAERGVGVRRLAPYTGPNYEGVVHGGKSLAGRIANRNLASTWRTSSFTGLTRNADSDYDHDARNAVSTSEATAEGLGARITMASVPAGAHPGQMLHHIFEHMDFADARNEGSNSDPMITCIADSLAAFGFDSNRWLEHVVPAYHEVLLTPLASEGRKQPFCLADIAKPQRLDELEFNIPVCEGRAPFQAAALVKALQKRTAAPWSDAYLPQVQNLGFRPLTGFLKGFMDLVFVHEGRWYLMDYKSNKLGETYGDYRPEAMAQSMAEHHYYLQYHVYLVALDRYLAMRIPNYDYERHMGGVYYLFMRGMHPKAPPGTGIFFDRPTADEVKSLSNVLSGGEP